VPRHGRPGGIEMLGDLPDVRGPSRSSRRISRRVGSARARKAESISL
jgi:hypothetical protein